MDPCDSSAMASSALGPYTYDVQSGSPLSLETLSWSVTPSQCGPIAYSIVSLDVNYPLTGVISLSGSTIVADTTDPNKRGTYTVEITASTSYLSVSETFTVDVIDLCDSSAISNSALGPYAYDLQSGSSQPLTTLAWVVSPSQCGTVAYSLSTNDVNYPIEGVISISGTAISVNT